MAPNIARSRGKTPALSPAQMRAALVELRRQVETNCDYVGERFAEEARKIHYGEAEERHIYGESTLAQAKEMVEEGIKIAPMPPDPDDRLIEVAVAEADGAQHGAVG